MNIATARAHGVLDDKSAQDLADEWNRAYPTMRRILDASISGLRARIQREGWTLDSLPKGEHGNGRDLGAKLARLEGTRRVLGQLDRGTYRGCTRSPGGFSPTSAYWSVRDFLAATTIADHGLHDVYALAAHLAFIADSLARQRATA